MGRPADDGLTFDFFVDLRHLFCCCEHLLATSSLPFRPSEVRKATMKEGVNKLIDMFIGYGLQEILGSSQLAKEEKEEQMEVNESSLLTSPRPSLPSIMGSERVEVRTAST